MTTPTPHTHLNTDEALIRLRLASARWEQAEPCSSLSEHIAEEIVAELRQLDRALCHGAPLPGEWQSVNIHSPGKPPKPLPPTTVIGYYRKIESGWYEVYDQTKMCIGVSPWIPRGAYELLPTDLPGAASSG